MKRLRPSKDTIKVAHALFDEEMLEYEDSNAIFALQNLAQSQLGVQNNIDFFINQESDDLFPTVTGLICTVPNVKIVFGAGENQSLRLGRGDVIIFPSELIYSSNDKNAFRIFKFKYSQNVDTDSGSKRFKVTATLIDKYETYVSADNEEEAIEKAKNISLSYWDHLDIYPDVEERKIIRYAKWNNFDAQPLTNS
jgi:hypothetical protein